MKAQATRNDRANYFVIGGASSVVVLTACWFAVFGPRPVSDSVDTTDDATLLEASEAMASFLTRACSVDGQFEYWIQLDPKERLSPKYNVLRHAGAVYSMASCRQRCRERRTQLAILRSARFLRQECIGVIDENPGMLAVWSDPLQEGDDGPREAKLGGTGLGLVALLSTDAVSPGEWPVEDFRRLGRFLRFMQKGDGDFYSKYVPSHGGRRDNWTSLYYPGEAALGLAMLYERDPQPQWLNSATRALMYLANERSGKTQAEPDHWALIATSRVLLHVDQLEDARAVRQSLISHARQICESMLAEKARYSTDDVPGCFTGDGRTTPTATRLEGLLAALKFLPQEEIELRRRIREAVEHGIAFLLDAYVKSGQYAGAVPRAIGPLPPNHPQFSESFNRRATEVRIDYVQHALSALLEYRNLREREDQHQS